MGGGVRVAGALVSCGLLLVTLALGFAASRGTVDPGLHGMLAVVAAGLAIASHVRRGSGGDLLATLLLVATVGAGVLALPGTGAWPHLGLAVVATGLSVGLHAREAAAGGRAAVGEAGG